MTHSIGDIVRPQLNRKVRLRFDRQTGHDLLLYPERGLELSQTATEIARLCTGEWTVDEIAQHLATIYTEMSQVDLRRDVRRFLKSLAARGLMQGVK